MVDNFLINIINVITSKILQCLTQISLIIHKTPLKNLHPINNKLLDTPTPIENLLMPEDETGKIF